MVDYTKITERVYTGARINNDDDIETLVIAGVTHIIDARAEFDDKALLMAKYPFILYLWNPTHDDGQPKPTEWFGKTLEFAMPALSHPGNVVYAHCAAGHNRGPSLAYAILRAQGLSRESALNVIKFHRPEATIAYSKDADLAVIELGWARA